MGWDAIAFRVFLTGGVAFLLALVFDSVDMPKHSSVCFWAWVASWTATLLIVIWAVLK